MVRRGDDSWTWAIIDTVLSVFTLVAIWYPTVHYTNALVGSPLSEYKATFAAGVFALGTAYPFVADDWSLGDLGEYLFLFLAAALGWGIVGMIAIFVSGLQFSGSDPVPQAVVWGLAYLTAYIVVFRTKITVFR